MRIRPSPAAVAAPLSAPLSASLSALLFPALLFPALLLAGCGTPPGLAETPDPSRPGTSAPAPVPTAVDDTPPVLIPTGPPPSGGFAAGGAVDCAGDPGRQAVVGVLRDEGVVPRAADVSVTTGPLCAGDWHYTVVTMPGADPLQVVTRRVGSGLRLVTAGSDVCTVEVRVQAPAGIRNIAGCPD